MRFPKKLSNKLTKRIQLNALRSLPNQNDFVDFSSNDYLGLAKSKEIFDKTHRYLLDNRAQINGATGSRLLSGNHKIYKELEQYLCTFHKSEAALVFNSGYDANIGFFSSVPQRGDIIIYDEFIHASIRDGIKMSDAKSYKFKHNDAEGLKVLLKRHSEMDSELQQEVFVVTESVFSMDGDTPDLIEMLAICEAYRAHFVIDEAHALGLFGTYGFGIVQELGLEKRVFARIVTFGKALGAHGAAILGSNELKQYLVNFSRSFIYTTGMSPHAVATILTAYKFLQHAEGKESIEVLKKNITYFTKTAKELELGHLFIESNSSIHCCLISGNEKVKQLALKLREKGFDIKPILSPTVPQGQERLRFCLHAYNSPKEIHKVLETLRIFVASH